MSPLITRLSRSRLDDHAYGQPPVRFSNSTIPSENKSARPSTWRRIEALLGADVERRAEQLLGVGQCVLVGDLRESEVEQHDALGARFDEDVARS